MARGASGRRPGRLTAVAKGKTPQDSAADRRMTRAGGLMLAALTLTRTGVALQFQSLSLLAPWLAGRLHADSADFGMLLGLYMAPGLGAAVATPMLLHRLGARGALRLALVLMVAGQIVLLASPTLWLAALARLLAGVGGCIVYLAAIDLAARLRGAGPLGLRMGVVAASWPFGNALALLLLGMVAATAGAPEAGGLSLGLLALAALLQEIAWRRRAPPDTRSATSLNLGRWLLALRRMLLPGLAFALYNIAFILLISFSPQVLTADGMTAPAASAIASLPMWLFLLSVPLGGPLAAGARWRDVAVTVGGMVGGAGCILASLSADTLATIAACYALAGLVGGLPTATLLARAGRSGDALAYFALFSIFFALLLIIPPLAGALIDHSGQPVAGLWVCIGLLALALGLALADSPDRRGRADAEATG